MAIAPICGKLNKMKAHVQKCQQIDVAARIQILHEYAKEVAGKENVPTPMRTSDYIPLPLQAVSSPSTHPASSRPWKRANTGLSNSGSEGPSPNTRWSANLMDEFNKDLCKLFVSCGFAWNAASNPEMHLFCEKWIPGSEVPDRRVLSGRVLDEEVERVEAKTKGRVEGKIATGISDGWKNIAKTPVNTTMIAVEHEVSRI